MNTLKQMFEGAQMIFAAAILLVGGGVFLFMRGLNYHDRNKTGQ